MTIVRPEDRVRSDGQILGDLCTYCPTDLVQGGGRSGDLCAECPGHRHSLLASLRFGDGKGGERGWELGTTSKGTSC